MLQFITTSSVEYSVPEQVQMVLEGGCEWIQYSRADESDELYVENARQIAQMCEETGVFMVIDHDVELCEKLRVHGVHLTPGDILPLDARERLGAHAVIGVTVTTAAEVIALKRADIDYVQVGPAFDRFGIDDYRALIAELDAAGCETPVVAFGDIAPGDVKALLCAGVRGIAIGAGITTADDPVEKVREYLAQA